MRFEERALLCPNGHVPVVLGGLPAPTYTCVTCGFQTCTLRDLQVGEPRPADAHGFPRRRKSRRTLRRRAW